MNRSSSIKKDASKGVSQYTSMCVPPETFTSAFGERKWLKCHGKEERINFSDQALSKLRGYFDSLDTEGKGSLGIEELEDPFIAFGLSQNREEVKELIDCTCVFMQLLTRTVQARSNSMNFWGSCSTSSEAGQPLKATVLPCSTSSSVLLVI